LLIRFVSGRLFFCYSFIANNMTAITMDWENYQKNGIIFQYIMDVHQRNEKREARNNKYRQNRADTKPDTKWGA